MNIITTFSPFLPFLNAISKKLCQQQKQHGRRNLNPSLPLPLPLLDTRNCFPEEKSIKAFLPSSWFQRLHLRSLPKSIALLHFNAPALLQPSPPPPTLPPFVPAGILDPYHPNTISIGESCTDTFFSCLHSAFFSRLLNFYY
ncbi:hypothetical protein AAC387_Pa08g0011 [Persea americana]